MIVKKASKRFHILRVLKRGGIPPHELILIYYALIRSVLEYCCIVWHNNLPAYLADSIERVQKRALNIILPGRSYREALSQLHYSRLDERRDALCERTIKKITDGNRLFYLLPQTRLSKVLSRPFYGALRFLCGKDFRHLQRAKYHRWKNPPVTSLYTLPKRFTLSVIIEGV